MCFLHFALMAALIIFTLGACRLQTGLWLKRPQSRRNSDSAESTGSSSAYGVQRFQERSAFLGITFIFYLPIGRRVATCLIAAAATSRCRWRRSRNSASHCQNQKSSGKLIFPKIRLPSFLPPKEYTNEE